MFDIVSHANLERGLPLFEDEVAKAWYIKEWAYLPTKNVDRLYTTFEESFLLERLVLAWTKKPSPNLSVVKIEDNCLSLIRSPKGELVFTQFYIR